MADEPEIESAAGKSKPSVNRKRQGIPGLIFGTVAGRGFVALGIGESITVVIALSS